MIVKLLTEDHLEFLSLKGGCTCSSEFITVMLIYRHCVSIEYNEKLSDIIVLETCVVNSTKKKLIKVLH